MVTLNEILGPEDDDPLGDLEVIVEVLESDLQWLGIEVFEGGWKPSSVKNIWYRIDPARPEMSQCRHIHVAHKKHIRTAGMQASWNAEPKADGIYPRHDRGNFNPKIGCQAKVQDVTRAALGLSPTAALEHLTSTTKAGSLLVELLELTNESTSEPIRFRLRLR